MNDTRSQQVHALAPDLGSEWLRSDVANRGKRRIVVVEAVFVGDDPALAIVAYRDMSGRQRRSTMPLRRFLQPAQFTPAPKEAAAIDLGAPLPPVPSARETREAFLNIIHGKGTAEQREAVLWFLFNAIEREEGRAPEPLF